MGYNSGKNHPKFIDLTGKIFGKLKVLDYIQIQEKHGNVWKWKCICDCGNYTYTRTKEFLKSKPVQSCAACGRKRMGKTNTIPDNGSSKNRVYRTYKRGAKNRGYKFDLTFEQVMEIMQKDCYYCGESPKLQESFSRNGIDRKNNREGYIINNVVPCCSICNRMKMDIDYNEFLDHISKIYSNINK